MTYPGLTPEDLKQHYPAEIIKESKTFETLGLSKEEAEGYLLRTPEGNLYLQRAIESNPTASIDKIQERAIGQIRSGLDLPRMETVNEPLVKIVPAGTVDKSLPYSPYFGKESEFNRAIASGQNLSEYFALPIKSEAQVYDVYRIVPKAPTEVFVNHVAPTSELGGQVTKAGGAEQYLVPNRKLHIDAERTTRIGNDLALHNELVVGKGQGAPIAPLAETATRGLSPELARGAGALGAAAVAYDIGATSFRANDLYREGNTTAATAQMEHLAGRNVGGLAFAAGGAELGSFGGPVGTFVGGAVGGAVGAFGGTKLMDAVDHQKIYAQHDAQGQTWSLDPAQPQQGWTRTVSTLDAEASRLNDGFPIYKEQTECAPPALADRLAYQANTTATELALGRVGPPADPYTQPATKQDTESFGDPPWRRNEQNGQWQRPINAPFVERQATPEPRTDIATPERAAQLDAAAQRTIAENLSTTKQSIAQQYQSVYAQSGWQQYGPMPEPVTTALHTPENTLEASNGHTYTRGADGQWTTPGALWNALGPNTAEGNVRAELDATRHQQRALHGESSQVERVQEAQRQQEVHGHAAAHEAPLPPAPGALSPGPRTAEREVSVPRHEPRPAARDQDAQTHTPARHEPSTPVTPDPNHAAQAAQQAHQQAMHAQRQAQQERQHDERPATPSRAPIPQEAARATEAAALAPAVASAAPRISEAAAVAPAVAATLRDAPTPVEPQRNESPRTPPAPTPETAAVAPAEHTRAQPSGPEPTAAPARPSEPVPSVERSAPQATAAPVLTPPLDPPSLKDFRNPEHPLNARYQMFRDALGEQGFHEARPTLNDAPEVRGYSPEQKDRLAAGFTAKVGSDMQFNTEIQHFRKDGESLLAIEHPERLGTTALVVAIPENDALARSPEQHTAGWRARELPEPQAVNTQRPDPQSLSPDHPGHPDHPRNAMFEHTRDALSTEYARWGIQKGAEHLDRDTVQVMTAARGGLMDDVGAVRLMPNHEEGKIGASPTMQVFETAEAAGRAPSTVFVDGPTLQQAPPAQQAAKQLEQVDLQAMQAVQAMQNAQAQVNAQGPQGPGQGGPGR
jgi:hypothetical protein